MRKHKRLVEEYGIKRDIATKWDPQREELICGELLKRRKP